jgi:hypothetical protein
MSDDNTSPRRRYVSYHPPGPDFWAEVERFQERLRLDGLSPTAKLRTRLNQRGGPIRQRALTSEPAACLLAVIAHRSCSVRARTATGSREYNDAK